MKYLEETYDTMIRKSYSYNQERQDNSPAWKVIRSLYEKNYVSSNEVIQKVPKKIHQIWLGSTFPDIYKKWANSWKKFNPDWEYKLWTDADVNDVTIPNRYVFNRITNQGQKSDYLRYHILNQFGGLYIDTDFECLKSFDDLLYLDFFTGVGYPDDVEVYIGLIGSVPHHPIIEHVVKSMTETKYDGDWKKMFNTTGTYFFTRKFLEVVKEDTKGVVAFPMDFFYPYPNNTKRIGDPYSWVKLCSYAIHHWSVSWRGQK